MANPPGRFPFDVPPAFGPESERGMGRAVADDGALERIGERRPAADIGLAGGIAAWVRRKPAHAFALAVAAGWLLGKISRVAQGRRRLR
ncbi:MULTISPECIES: hypothetical protein [Lysobacter]|uniref:DUF3618 domain-containing protein n=1 Tax=Lysobacter yananisis TaxID=1003114 RepID=A0ABY9P5N7_9GAMM|nr:MULTISPECIES: hypothetical protein [Lysobacter]QQP99066.1 hypothetical protein JHW41_13035 [Lysobacter enzymogenes]UZW58509.1 hypothetical protein BV903_014380 [Lysobacter enzymogenes]WMT02221.1 hypothetical protein RDV84_19965 [Lysobacter yananisis]